MIVQLHGIDLRWIRVREDFVDHDVAQRRGRNRVVSAGAPKTVNEIETVMKKQGLGNMKIGAK